MKLSTPMVTAVFGTTAAQIVFEPSSSLEGDEDYSANVVMPLPTVVNSRQQQQYQQGQHMEAAAFSSLYDTVLAYFFSSYGYPRSVAHSVVSKESVREACAVAVDVSAARGPTWIVDDNCTLDEVGRQLRAFVSREEYTYFLYYVAIAVPLITLAIAFNTLAVLAVCRIRRRQPRHVIAISLSVSDVILTTTTLIKRCGVVEVDEGPLSDPFLRNILEQEVNVLWQSAFAMSALGLVCLAADNFIAVAAPFHYGTFSSSTWVVGVMPGLWVLVLVVMVGLRLANLNYSVIVQYVVAALICTLLFVILTAYGFTCFQALLYRRRTDQWAQPEQKINMRRRLLKGFFTTTLLVMTCLLSWGPLVCYLLVDEEVINAAHPVFLKFLLFCLAMFHLGAVLNPLIYSMRIRGIRISLFQMLKISGPSGPGNGFTTVNAQHPSIMTSLKKNRSAYSIDSPNRSVRHHNHHQHNNSLNNQNESPINDPAKPKPVNGTNNSRRPTNRTDSHTPSFSTAPSNGNSDTNLFDAARQPSVTDSLLGDDGASPYSKANRKNTENHKLIDNKPKQNKQQQNGNSKIIGSEMSFENTPLQQDNNGDGPDAGDGDSVSELPPSSSHMSRSRLAANSNGANKDSSDKKVTKLPPMPTTLTTATNATGRLSNNAPAPEKISPKHRFSLPV